MKRSTSTASSIPFSDDRRAWLESKSKKSTGSPSPANALTASVIKHIRASGGYAVRIQTQGQFRDGRWTKGTTRLGTADVHACFRGIHLSIEIKIGKDTQSDEQRETAREVQKSGGLYFVARTLDEFLLWFEGLKKKGGPGA